MPNHAIPAKRFRLFIAVPVPEPVALALHSAVAGFVRGSSIRGLSATDPGSMHLTLCFVGEVDGIARDAAIRACEGLGAVFPPFGIGFSNAAWMPGGRRPRVLVMECDADTNPGVGRLVSGIRAALESEGLPFDARPARPHVTVARLRGRQVAPYAIPAELPDPPVPEGARFTPDCFVVYESILRAGGPEYRALARIPFRS